MAKRKSVDQWPVIWRVVAPNCGSYNRDMVYVETEDEGEARKRFAALRRGKWPVRIERVQCGPLPEWAMPSLQSLYKAGEQVGGSELQEIPAYWTQR